VARGPAVRDALGRLVHAASARRPGIVHAVRSLLAGEQDRLATALAASEARYRHLVDNAPDIIYRTDEGGHFTFVNPIAEAILGRSQAELLGRSYLELIHPADRDAMRRHYGRQWVRKTPTTYAEFRVSTSGRGQVWIGQNVQLIIEGGQRAGFQAVARDITDRKRAQEALARLQQQTESILTSAAEGIVSMDRQGRLVMVNPAAAHLTGYTIQEMQGQSAHALVHHSRPDGSPFPATECRIHAALGQGSTRGLQTDVFWRRDGSSFPVEYTVVPLFEEGQVTGAVLTFHDISERMAIERMKDQFISVVSHELRTPLASIRGSLGLLASGLLDRDAERARRMLELAVGNTDRLVRLINDILDVERMASGELVLDRRRVTAQALVRSSVDGVQALADAAHIRLVHEAEPVAMLADEDRVVQALTNLLGNAIKFSPPGSTVTVQASSNGSAVVFSVRDQGRGIPADKLTTIFNRFEQVDASDSREQGGVGLGLPISRSLIELHGGRLSVESRVGEGSTFWFTIPADHDDNDDHPAPPG